MCPAYQDAQALTAVSNRPRSTGPGFGWLVLGAQGVTVVSSRVNALA